MGYKKMIRSYRHRSGGSDWERTRNMRRKWFWEGTTIARPYAARKRPRRKPRYMKPPAAPWSGQHKETQQAANRRERRTHKRVHDWEDHLRDDGRIT